MRTFLRIVALLALTGVIVLLAMIFVPVRLTPAVAALPADWRPAEGQGEYVMRAGDCAACHTAEDGRPFAGGRPIESPMGTIYSTNITPDPDQGIGRYTLDQFRAALYDGIRGDGAHLYPAMPYENYRMLTEEDVRALYDYFMNEVPPVADPIPATDLAFPFNQRWGIRAWNWLALRHPAGFTPVYGDELLDRGKYLVEAPGHCGACHSPRNLLMMQDGVTLDGGRFLQGGAIAGWEAPPLSGPASAPQRWDIPDMARYLGTGRNNHSTANGEMGLVVEESMQHLTPGDRIAIAAFLKGMPGGEVVLPATTEPSETVVIPHQPAGDAGKETEALLVSAPADMAIGPRLYADNCMACHFASGTGAAQIFPKLAGNTLVQSDETMPLISIILNGAHVPSTAQRPMQLVMQGYRDRLNDQEVAELATFLRSAWGNNAGPITTERVAEVRAETAEDPGDPDDTARD